MTNDGGTPLTDITVIDTRQSIGAVCNHAGPLMPGDSTTCTALYVTTAADAQRNSVESTASVSARAGERTITASTSRTILMIYTQAAGVSIATSVTPTSFTRAGQRITYTYNVTNSGTVPLKNIYVYDTIYRDLDSVCQRRPGQLAAGRTLRCTLNYVTTADDVRQGSITNDSMVSPTARGRELHASTSRTIFLVGGGAPGISITASAHPTVFTGDNQLITYTYTVVNDGTTPLASVNINDPTTNNPDTGYACDLEAFWMEPGDSQSCTASHLTTASDVHNGTLTITPTVSAYGAARTITATTSRTIVLSDTVAPSISIAESVDPIFFDRAGQTLSYTFTATNDGPIPLTDLTIEGSQATGDLPCRLPRLLAPGAAVTCKADYRTTDADVSRGEMIPKVTVTATGNGHTLTATTSRTVVLVSDTLPTVRITNRTSPSSYTTPGQPISYSYTVTNDGVVALTDIVVTHNPTGEEVCRPTGPLKPHESITCTARYPAPDSDRITTEGFVSARGGGQTVTARTTRLLSRVGADVPTITITSSATPSTYSRLRQRITYTYTVTNDGPVPLNNIQVSDPLTDDPSTGQACYLSEPLAPGDSTTCTADHLVTGADLKNGRIANHPVTLANDDSHRLIRSASSREILRAQPASLKPVHPRPR